VLRANNLESGYLRPIAFYGSEKMGVSPKGAKVHVAIAAWPWGAYLGEEGMERGIRVKTFPATPATTSTFRWSAPRPPAITSIPSWPTTK
jgi:branched-subunit amino acid aminotransferase/4-amino-4-deoxychorismate lyase